jgi:hypothetical protein
LRARRLLACSHRLGPDVGLQCLAPREAGPEPLRIVDRAIGGEPRIEILSQELLERRAGRRRQEVEPLLVMV